MRGNASIDIVYKARVPLPGTRDLVGRFPRAESVFVEFHVHAPAAKLDSFHGEAKALLRCGLSSKFDLAASADNTLPRYGLQRSLSQQSGYGSMIEGITCSRSHLAVGRNLALGNRTNDAAKGGVAWRVVAQRILQNSSLEVLRNSRAAHAQNYNKGPGLLRARPRGTICRLRSPALGQV